MLRHPNGRCMPMIEYINGHEWTILFESEEEAEKTARENMLGESYGFEVYEW